MTRPALLFAFLVFAAWAGAAPKYDAILGKLRTDDAAAGVWQPADADLDDLADGTLSKSKVQDSTNWDTAYGWGDHAGAGYLTAETDPDYNAWIATVTPANWDTAYGWGDHAGAGYLTAETDPDYNAWIATVTPANWDTAYGWGDHGAVGYLTAEADPDYNAWIATVTPANWDTAYGWGDHAGAGYLTAETDPDYNAWIATVTPANWDTAYGWGDHGGAGYLTAEADDIDDVTGRGATTTNGITVGSVDISAGGDLTLIHALGSVQIEYNQGSTPDYHIGFTGHADGVCLEDWGAGCAATVGSIAWGLASAVTNAYGFALGQSNSTGGAYSMTVGSGCQTSADYAMAMGISCTVSAAAGFAAGDSASVDVMGTAGVAMGYAAYSASEGAIAIGYGASASGDYAVALGEGVTTGASSLVFGAGSDVSAEYGIALGLGATVTASAGVALGDTTTAAGGSSFAGGCNTVATGDYSTCLGFGGEALGAYSVVPGGAWGIARLTGELAHSSGGNTIVSDGAGNEGDAQFARTVPAAYTTDATPTELALYGGAGLAIPSGYTVAFHIVVAARAHTGESAAYQFVGCVENVAGTTAIVGSVTKTVVAEDNAAWDCAVTADDANDTLDITATGAAGTNCNWCATVEWTIVVQPSAPE